MPISLGQIAREEGFQTAGLCARVGISERHMRRVFDEGLGISPNEWLRQQRMVAARNLLRHGRSIKEVAGELGFSNPKVFSRDFLVFHGVRPTDFQRKEAEHVLNAISA